MIRRITVADLNLYRAIRLHALRVTRDNDRARRLYERAGFSVTGDSQPLPSDPRKEEIRMMREI